MTEKISLVTYLNAASRASSCLVFSSSCFRLRASKSASGSSSLSLLAAPGVCELEASAVLELEASARALDGLSSPTGTNSQSGSRNGFEVFSKPCPVVSAYLPGT